MGKATRGKGEGSIFQLASGYWCGAVEAGRYPNGGRRKARVIRRRKDDVIAEMARLRDAAARGAPIDRRTVAAYLEFWLDDVIATEVTPQTLAQYRHRIARVTPHIGTIRLDRLTKTHVQQLATRLAETYPRSPRTRTATLTTLRQALRWAVPEMIPHNPAEGVRNPRTARATVDDTLTADQAKAVVAAAAGKPGEALVWLAVNYGLRIGELLGLRWADIDDDEMTVRRSKTRAGERTIPLIDEARAVLDRHRRTAGVRALDGTVFVSPRGTPVSRDTATKWWNDALVAAKVPHRCRNCGSGETCSTSVRRFHSSRHTAATVLLESGVELEVVSAILGHANIAVTADVYAKVRADLKRKALNRRG